MKLLILILLLAFAVPFNANALQSQQYDQFADADTIAAPGSVYTKWYDIRNFTSIDYTISASAGDGNIEVEWASEAAGSSVVLDGTVVAFDTTENYSILGGVVSKFYTRLRIDCVTAPCKYSGWFTAKGQR